MKDQARDWIKIGLIGGISAFLVQIVFLIVLLCIPSSNLTNLIFPTFLGIRNEFKETLKIGASFLWGQIDLFHSHPSKNTDLKVLTIKMNPTDYRLLLEPIPAWEAAGVKLPNMQDWVKAKFFFENQEWPVKVKLAGKRPDHWEDTRKSLSVKFTKDNLFLGQREIRLYPPYYKGGIVTGELMDRLARKLDLITPRSEYVVLNFNGIDQGVYFMVEDYRKEMIAWNDRPDTSPLYDLENENYHLFGHTIIDDGLRRTANFASLVKTEGKIREMADRRIAECLDWAFNGTEQDHISGAGKYLDLEKFAAFEAIRSLYHDEHGKIGSSRLYYNPTNGKIEPVLWDAYIPVNWLSSSPEAQVASRRFPLREPYEFNQFLRDPKGYLLYNRALYELIRDDSVIKLYDEIYEKVRREYLSSPVRKLEVKIGYLAKKELENPRIFLESNIQHIRNTLEGKNLDQGVFILIFNDSPKKTLRFDMETLSVSEISLTQVNLPFPCVGTGRPITATLFADTNGNRSLDLKDRMLAEAICEKDMLHFRGIDERYVSPRDSSFLPLITRAVLFVTWDAPDVSLENDSLEKTEFHFANLVTKTQLQAPLWVRAITDFTTNSYEAKVYPSFIRFDGNRISFLPGRHTVSKSLVFPRGLPVTIPAGTHLLMDEGVSLLVRGDLTIAGQERQPVVIESADPQKPFGTLAILKANVVIDHLELKNGSEAYLDGVYFIGQMNVYHGDLTLMNSRIAHSHSDDGLNVKYGLVKILNNHFENNSFDALDLDYCTGEIAENVFINAMTPDGDGIDLSGSTLLLRGNTIRGFGDKGISIGERSRPVIFDNLIDGNNIGIAIKDLSETEIYSSTISGNQTGISLYQKKPHFGGGNGKLFNSILANQDDIEMDNKSTLEAFNSSSATEAGYGFMKLTPDPDNPFFSKGANPEYIQKFVNLAKKEYPLGILSHFPHKIQ